MRYLCYTLILTLWLAPSGFAEAAPQVFVRLGDMTVTSDSNSELQDFRYGVFYAQNTERTLGLQVRSADSYPAGVRRGDRVQLEGLLSVDPATDETYLQLYNSPVTPAPASDLPRPLTMRASSLGGNARTLQSLEMPGVNLPKPTGPYNKGLLVATWGVVTHINYFNRFFYIDDGERLLDGYGPYGVRISYDYQETGSGNEPIQPPALYDTVSVTGISASEVWEGHTIRVVKLRQQNDLAIQSSGSNSKTTSALAR
ncbi:MAG: hypothetical protein IT209_00085 [Armatimonadetes bacterium]|nr:hypothetical protein [Armatimonadota bacterium]